MDDRTGAQFGLVALATCYLFFLIVSVAGYGEPFPFMGTVYWGADAHGLVFVDSMITLYLLLGIIKRQALTWWLLIAYNLLDVANALVNLALVPPREYELMAGAPVPQEAILGNAVVAVGLVLLLNVYIYRRRRLFTNRSPYLF